MLSIRLKRMGKKKHPSYRIVVMDKRKDPQANYIEAVGFYNPQLKTVELKKERIKYWLSVGAQPSATVHNLLVNENVIKKPKIKISIKKEKAQEEKKAEEAKNALDKNNAS